MLEKFEFEAHEIRTLVEGGDPWFVATDVARALGYVNPRDAIRKHVDEDDKGVAFCDTLGGRQRTATVNESGLYALIFGSKKEEARRFKRWVTSEVLPTIRKTGGYVRPDATADQLASLAEEIAKLRSEAVPPLMMWRSAEENAGGYLLSDVAKSMGVPVRLLRAAMIEDQFLIPDDAGSQRRYKPTRRMRELGYLALSSGVVHVTRAGAEFLRSEYA
ncbi:Bro-N domain-containing protein [Streptomyces sp. NPDC090442]|uniref:BRO-N domain-containing protein n=1 Tax=Streptomyces sp. NPDC090442 TaxID=3365962 RepID=UPI00380A63FB